MDWFSLFFGLFCLTTGVAGFVVHVFGLEEIEDESAFIASCFAIVFSLLPLGAAVLSVLK